MRYSEDADLDTSAVEDMRGGGGGGLGGFGGRGIAVGGGGLGLVGLVIVVLIQVLGGGGSGTGTGAGAGTGVGGFPNIGQGQSADNSQLAAECRTGGDANAHVECAV